ncbi:MAG: PepSY domain-containing protein [Colwellia sp.]|nr:PepSY domain-containing protein [Colwellia sp.]
MDKEFLKRITDAHSWLGLIISGLLFIIFFAGSIALFRDEINQWSFQPHYEVAQGEKLAISEVMEKAISGRKFTPKEHLIIITPSDNLPYYTIYVDVEHEEGEKDYVGFFMDPVSGEEVAAPDDYFLATFIYALHVNLNIPNGSYIIGFVTLFFFFALISGIFIHARKMFSNFFKYRAEKQKRSQLLDMHNIVGVMSLPFTIMYAISGLIFNLVIIYQIAFAVVLYQGDQQALLDDAGYQAVEPQWLDKPWKSPNIDQIYAATTDKYNTEPRMIRMYNYGDESAVMHMFGQVKDDFAEEYEVAYNLSNDSPLLIKDSANPNTLVQGLHVISRLHFGNYAGFDLRIIYFILGIGVCGLIITGNMLWLEKRARQRNQSEKTLKFVTNFTLLSTGGIVLATSMAFLAERLLPITFSQREDYMVYSFVLSLALVAFSLIFNHNKKLFLSLLLRGSALILLLVLIVDWVMFGSKGVMLWQQGIKTIIGTEIGIMVMALLFYYCGAKLKNKQSRVSVNDSDDELLAVRTI